MLLLRLQNVYDLPKRRILVVSNDDTARTSLLQMLVPWAWFHVETAIPDQGSTAKKWNGEYDLLILDLRQHPRDGWGLYHTLCRQRETAVLGILGDSGRIAPELCFEGDIGLLVWPCSASGLLAKVTEILELETPSGFPTAMTPTRRRP